MTTAAELQDPPSHTQSLAQLSRGLVQLFRHRAGRGPTQAKSYWAGDDALLVLFGGGYTKAEQTLWEQGRPDTAAAYRQAVFEALEEDMRAVVRTSVGRTVDAVLVSAHHKPDVMATVFLLEPLGGNGSAEAGRWGADNSSAPPPPLGPPTPGRPERYPLAVDDGPASEDVAARGRERREAAEQRAEEARERAVKAREEARTAPSPEAAEVHEREAEIHDRAIRVHEDAAEVQRQHEIEHSDDRRDEEARGSDG